MERLLKLGLDQCFVAPVPRVLEPQSSPHPPQAGSPSHEPSSGSRSAFIKAMRPEATHKSPTSVTSQDPLPRACVECRRLKRKCDRLDPCNVCTRHGKVCVYKDLKPARPLPTKDASGPPPFPSTSDSLSSTSPGSFGSSTSPSNSMEVASVHSPDPLPLAGPSSTFSRMIYAPPPPTMAPSLPPPPTPAPVLPSRGPQSDDTAAALERQPRHAAGYEWNERLQTTSDGTASLSVEPDGEGYLGFASGATLLRILQLCAGGTSLTNIASDSPEAPHPEWLPAHMDREKYLNAYFALFHTQYPLIHEPTFRAQHAEVVPRPPMRQWNLLVNVVLGLGAFCSFEPMYKVDHFLERSVALISVEQLASGSLTLVQSFCLLSNLAQRRNQPNSGWTYLGIAVHMAIGLGLHRELPSWNITPFDREVRRRIWWTVYCFHSGASITFGRPLLLPEGEADVKMIQNVVDRSFTPSLLAVPPTAIGSTLYSSLIHQASFHQIGNRCYTRVISSPHPDDSAQILGLDSELQSWYSTLPDSMKPYSPAQPWLDFTAQKLLWRYSNLRIILHRRAFLERVVRGLPLWPGSDLIQTGAPSTAEEADALSSHLCLESASDSIGAIHQFFAARHANRLEWWYGLHFLFHASFVPLIALHSDPTSLRKASWQQDVDRARDTLNTLKEDPLADRCLRIVNLLVPSAPLEASARSTPSMGSIDNPFLSNLQNNTEIDELDFSQTWLPFVDYTSLNTYLGSNGLLEQNGGGII